MSSRYREAAGPVSPRWEPESSVSQGQRLSDDLLHAREKPRGEHRMSANLEKVVRLPNWLNAEHLLPDRDQHGLQRIVGSLVRRRLFRREPSRAPERLPIQLAVRSLRQRWQRNQMRWHHVIRAAGASTRCARFPRQPHLRAGEQSTPPSRFRPTRLHEQPRLRYARRGKRPKQLPPHRARFENLGS